MLNLISEASGAVEAAASREWYEALVSINPTTIIFTLINALIIFLIFRFFLYKPVCNILDQRKEIAAKEIAEAQAAKESAQKTEQEYLERLAEAKSEAAEIMKQATARAQAREEEIISEANSKAAEIRVKAEEAIERDKKRAMNEIKDEISDIVILAATKVVEKEISAKDNEEIISNFLVNVGADE
ncbi:MAG: F0F1 ATP synthase subunit B [Oscillospiraceae bacterium]|nr:F0F1 ATP synthase subunit B [Oscillospiraceae bacterium]